MADRYIRLDSTGALAEREATAASAGSADAGKIVATGSDGLLSSTLLPTGNGPEMETVPASEGLSAGDLVNFHDVSGVTNARKADAATGKPADGHVRTSVTQGNNADVYRGGRNTAVTGLTPGEQFLSATTPGKCSTTVPSSGIVQRVGYATTATSLAFARGAAIKRN